MSMRKAAAHAGSPPSTPGPALTPTVRPPGNPGTAWELPVESYRLANGLEVVLQPDSRSPVVVVHLALGVGSASDPAGFAGLAHLSEHLVYAGLAPGRLRAYPTWVQSRGGVPGALTTHDRSHFFEILPAGQILSGLWLEADRLRHAGAEIPAQILERERAVLLQERAQQVENPTYGGLYENLHQELFPQGHPYHHSPMGSRDGLQAITGKHVSEYLETALSANNAVLVITGDFSPGEVKGPIEEHFSSLGSSLGDSLGNAPSQKTRPRDSGSSWTDSGDARLPEAVVMGSRGRGRRRLREPVPFPRTIVAFPAPGENGEGFPAASLLARTLAGGPGSPLVQSLVYDTGLVQEVASGMVEMRHASTLVVDATAAPGVGSDELEEGVIQALEACLAAPFPEGLVAAARHAALRELTEEIDSLDSRAEWLARLALAERPLTDLGLDLQRYSQQTSRELATSGQNICRRENRLVLSLEPTGGVP